MEQYYITALRNCLAYRHDPATGPQNRYDAKSLIQALRNERNGRAAALRNLYRN